VSAAVSGYRQVSRMMIVDASWWCEFAGLLSLQFCILKNSYWMWTKPRTWIRYKCNV